MLNKPVLSPESCHMASLGHNELITSSRISNAEYLVRLEYGLSIQGLHAKHIAKLAYRNSILPQKCPDDKYDISLQVLTYEYCAYYIQSLHTKCAVKVINRQIKITFSLANASQWTEQLHVWWSHVCSSAIYSYLFTTMKHLTRSNLNEVS